MSDTDENHHYSPFQKENVKKSKTTNITTTTTDCSSTHTSTSMNIEEEDLDDTTIHDAMVVDEDTDEENE